MSQLTDWMYENSLERAEINLLHMAYIITKKISTYGM